MRLRAHLKILTQLGHTPEFYVDIEKSQDVLNYTELLTMFGAEELENQLLNDQGAFLVPVPDFISLLLRFALLLVLILLGKLVTFCFVVTRSFVAHTHTHSIYIHTQHTHT